MSVLLCYSFSGFGLVSKVLVILHTFPSKKILDTFIKFLFKKCVILIKNILPCS